MLTLKKLLKQKEKGIVKDENFYKSVELKAYELYEKRGCAHGQDLDDWLQAEKAVEREAAPPIPVKRKRSAKRF